jgi:gephyrin
MVEDTKLVSTFEANEGDLEGEEKEVETLAQVPPAENVRAPGSDVHKGDLVLAKGERILGNGGEIGTLAFVGRKEVSVHRKPVVGVLSTGNEIVDLHDQASVQWGEWGGIFDTNRPSIQAALEMMGYSVIDLGIVADTWVVLAILATSQADLYNSVEAHVAAIKEGIEKADILITTGGTSMGPTDLLKPVIERHFNGTIHFGRVTIKPGKPTTFATIPAAGGVAKPMFALPGNPASALVTFHIFVVPALRKLAGWPSEMLQLPRITAEVRIQYDVYWCSFNDRKFS